MTGIQRLLRRAGAKRVAIANEDGERAKCSEGNGSKAAGRGPSPVFPWRLKPTLDGLCMS